MDAQVDKSCLPHDDSSDDEVLLAKPIFAAPGAAEAPATKVVESVLETSGRQQEPAASNPNDGDTEVAVKGSTSCTKADEVEAACEPMPSRSEDDDRHVEDRSEGPAALAWNKPLRPLPTWWDRNFMVQYRNSDTALGLKLKGLGLRDADIGSLCLALDGFLALSVDPNMPLEIEIDASDNKLTDRGGVRLVGWLGSLLAMHPGGIRVRVIKLYKNKLSDATCEALAALLLVLPNPVEEIHLSHNEIEQRGFVVLLAALALHPQHVYPRPTRSDPCPCWVRVEHNQVAESEQLLLALQAEPVRLRVCLAPRSTTGGYSCTSFQCHIAAPTWDAVAHVHLYCVHSQSSSSSFIREKPQKLVREVAAAVKEGELRPVVPNRKATYCNQLAVATPDCAVDLRDVVLNVDKECGAGIDLEPGAYGFLVVSVESSPGQDLKAGDVITEIDGLPLWGSLDEDVLNAAFGSRFGDGACLRVAAETELQQRSFWQPLSFPGEPLEERCETLIESLRQDLTIMGQHYGAKVTLLTESCAVSLQGPPRSQQQAVAELLKLLNFYFPESQCTASLPSGCWRGDVDPLCALPDDAVESTAVAEGAENAAQRVEHFPDLNTWENALHKQWSEDDDLFDEDLPCEPLEAPDDGPDTFEGEVLVDDFEFNLPLRILMLVGLPGSGKSTLATRLWDLGWHTVNQDTLGDRKACVAAAKKYLQAGKRIVIDRCNVSLIQRRVWLGIADELEVCAGCMWLDVNQDECGSRVLRRFGHQTLPADSSSLKVIAAFRERMEAPVEAEGFVLWRARCQDELEIALEEISELADRSETDFAETAGETRVSGTWRTVESPQNHVLSNGSTQAEDGARFRYREVRGRGARGQYLRAVRRQVEYYFCDANLRQDWFFQEKINEEPESGWLELRWILSCPRIRDVHKANEVDVLEALVPSTLIVRQMDGVHWVRRGRPLPKLLEPRPAKGREPEWYKALHGDVNDQEHSPRDPDMNQTNKFAVLDDDLQNDAGGDPENPRCTVCKKEHPKGNFSKAQLTKHRKAPTCKNCIAGG